MWLLLAKVFFTLLALYAVLLSLNKTCNTIRDLHWRLPLDMVLAVSFTGALSFAVLYVVGLVWLLPV